MIHIKRLVLLMLWIQFSQLKRMLRRGEEIGVWGEIWGRSGRSAWLLRETLVVSNFERPACRRRLTWSWCTWQADRWGPHLLYHSRWAMLTTGPYLRGSQFHIFRWPNCAVNESNIFHGKWYIHIYFFRTAITSYNTKYYEAVPATHLFFYYILFFIRPRCLPEFSRTRVALLWRLLCFHGQTWETYIHI